MEQTYSIAVMNAKVDDSVPAFQPSATVIRSILPFSARLHLSTCAEMRRHEDVILHFTARSGTEAHRNPNNAWRALKHAVEATYSTD
jgi:hypothetical protein